MILYEDKQLLVCHKQAGMPVQSASVRQKDMVSILRNHLGGADVYVVHRLDQPVEGVVVFAKTKEAAADLSRQISNGSMKKVYQAVVELPENAAICEDVERIDISEAENITDSRLRFVVNEWCTLVDYLVKDGRNNCSFVSNAEKPGAKRAELRYRILKWRAEAQPEYNKERIQADIDEKRQVRAVKKLALAEIELMTGRHHQIRVQMAHAGLPLVGDRKYNPGYAKNESASGYGKRGLSPLWKDVKEAEAGSGKEHFQKSAYQRAGDAEVPASLALCAVSLTFWHPKTKKSMTFEVEPQFCAVNGVFSKE